MKCSIHLEKDATGSCTSCGNLYCDDDFIRVQNRKNICKTCAAEQLSGGKSASSNITSPTPGVVVVQQQQQQEQPAATPVVLFDSRPSNGGRIALWVLSVILILSGLGNIGSHHDRVFGLLVLMAGIALLPPVLDRIRGMFKSSEDPSGKAGESK